MSDLILIRGDRAQIAISDLVDANLAPTTFQINDVVRWTAKRRVGEPDADAFLHKVSTDSSQISLAINGSTGTIFIKGSDWTTLTPPLVADLPFAWDLQIAVGGNIDAIVTLVRGEGTVKADVTRTAP